MQKKSLAEAVNRYEKRKKEMTRKNTLASLVCSSFDTVLSIDFVFLPTRTGKRLWRRDTAG